jgi:crotonobetainyl-CoA:carnitine CoA-transferase CaiB-like acyl-CoA transferase
LEKWGFNKEWFEINAPTLVRCSITGYGSTGPYSDLPGYDFILQAESGLMSISGPVDGEPTKYGVAIVDLATGMMAANAIQAALLARYRTGKGQAVEVSLFDTSTALLANVGNSHLATNKESGRYGNGHPTIVPYTTYHCSDAMVALAVGNDKQFANLSELLGHAEWAKDERLTTNAARVQNRKLIDGLLQDVLKTYQSEDLIQLCRSNGIPIGRVNTVSQALAQEHTQARGMVLNVEHSKIGEYRSLASPLKLHGTPNDSHRAPPLLGQDTNSVLEQYLGLSSDELKVLRDKKVIN